MNKSELHSIMNFSLICVYEHFTDHKYPSFSCSWIVEEAMASSCRKKYV